MKIAVVGAGLAGLATCEILSQNPKIQLTLFDSRGIGLGASFVSTGLLHPFPGKHAFLSRHGKEAFIETLDFLEKVERETECKVHMRCGVFRPAMTDEQFSDFQKSVMDGLSEWKNGGLWIPQGSVVFMKQYLSQLWKLTEKRGVQFQKEKISTLNDLASFDQIIVTTGFETLDLPECKHFPLKKTKGQALFCKTKEKIPYVLASNGHIAPTEDPNIISVGSTYEHHFTNILPDRAVADLLLKQVSTFYPQAKDFEVIDIVAGVRISHPNRHVPLIEKVSPNTILFTGLGSRGLLYHHFFAKKVAEMVLNRA